MAKRHNESAEVHSCPVMGNSSGAAGRIDPGSAPSDNLSAIMRHSTIVVDTATYPVGRTHLVEEPQPCDKIVWRKRVRGQKSG